MGPLPLDGRKLAWLYLSLSGRLSQGAYFLAGLLLFLLHSFLLYRFALAPDGSDSQAFWALAFWGVALASVWPNIALTGKRLHDFGKPAGWAVVTLFFGFIVFIVLAFIRGDPGPNRYGETTNAPA
jgi:uncharacterized membrane protein YhaH (DUF805 family)